MFTPLTFIFLIGTCRSAVHVSETFAPVVNGSINIIVVYCGRSIVISKILQERLLIVAFDAAGFSNTSFKDAKHERVVTQRTRNHTTSDNSLSIVNENQVNIVVCDVSVILVGSVISWFRWSWQERSIVFAKVNVKVTQFDKLVWK